MELAFYLRAQAWEAKKKKPTLAPTSPNSELLTIKDVARELGVGYRLAQTAINTGQIPSVVIGKCRMVSRTALDRWLLLGQPVITNPLPDQARLQT